MVRRWDRFRNPWDREYAMRGRLWRGVEDATFLHPYAAPPRRALEVGCGDGKFLAGLSAAGYDPIGLDAAPHALRLARARGTWPLLLADACSMPLATAAVALVAARYLLGALPLEGRRSAARELERVLAPEGVLLLEEFSTDDFRASVGRPVEESTVERNRGILTHYFAAGELEQLFPRLHTVSVEERRSAQRTAQGPRPRRRWRLLLARSSHGSNDSRRGAPGATS